MTAEEIAGMLQWLPLPGVTAEEIAGMLRWLPVTVGWVFCWCAFRIARRFRWVGFWTTHITILLVGGLPIYVIVRVLGGSYDQVFRYWQAALLGATCGALCAGIVQSEERKRHEQVETEAKREEYRRYLQQDKESA